MRLCVEVFERQAVELFGHLAAQLIRYELRSPGHHKALDEREHPGCAEHSKEQQCGISEGDKVDAAFPDAGDDDVCGVAEDSEADSVKDGRADREYEYEDDAEFELGKIADQFFDGRSEILGFFAGHHRPCGACRTAVVFAASEASCHHRASFPLLSSKESPAVSAVSRASSSSLS